MIQLLTKFIAVVDALNGTIVLIGGVAAVADPVVHPSTGNGLGLVSRVRAVEGSVGTGRSARLIAAIVTIAVVVVYLGELNGATTIQTGELVPRLIQAGPANRHATGTRDVASYVDDAIDGDAKEKMVLLPVSFCDGIE